MFSPVTRLPRRLLHARIAVIFVLTSASQVWSIDLDDARKMLDDGRYGEAVKWLQKETDENPAHKTARIWLAEAYEKSGKTEQAIETWQELMIIARGDETLRIARRALSRLRRIEIDRRGQKAQTTSRDREDPFRIPMPQVDWAGLEVVEDTDYLPPILPAPYDFEVPPFARETEHFRVYSTNERLSEVIGQRAEIYMEFMIDTLFGGRSWPVRFPIVVYPTYSDYVQHGAPEGTGGVTMRHITGSTEFILLYQLKPQSAGGGGSRRRSGGRDIWKYGIESVLPHELTHAVINEFFAGQPTPTWLHEAIAGRFEQTRDHYGEATRLARQVAAGEYFRVRDLFNQKGYPERISLFYEQSATLVLYLFETGPETMHAFLGELAAGNGHDAACAAALGIPVENAVEEFERRWVEWMKMLHANDSDLTNPAPDEPTAARSKNAVFQPWVNEMETVKGIERWRAIDLSSLAAFADIDNSKQYWTAEGRILRVKPTDEQGGSLLGVRINETPPLVIKCTIKCRATPGIKTHWFGFTQLDANRNDSVVQVRVPVRDISSHEMVAIWSDDLALYMDGTAVARYPATFVSGDAPDIDFPLAIIADGPFQLEDLRVAHIGTFSDKPVATQADDSPKRSKGRRKSRRRRSP